MCMQRTHDEMTALSIVNDGFIKVFKNIHSFREEGVLEGWIRRVVYNCLSDYFRRKSNVFKLSPVVEKTESPSTFTQLYYDDILQMVDKLGPVTKEVFMLHAIEGYKHREIAEMINIPENTSKWHLSMARQQLKRMLEENEMIMKRKKQ